MFIDPKKYDKHYSEKEFFQKLKKIIKMLSSKALKQIITLYVLLKNDNVPFYAKTMIVATLGYLICPIDVIPDFIPGGLVDDLLAVGFVLAELNVYSYDEVTQEVDDILKSIFGDGKIIVKNEK